MPLSEEGKRLYSDTIGFPHWDHTQTNQLLAEAIAQLKKLNEKLDAIANSLGMPKAGLANAGETTALHQGST